jgi:hypothetical protein
MALAPGLMALSASAKKDIKSCSFYMECGRALGNRRADVEVIRLPAVAENGMPTIQLSAYGGTMSNVSLSSVQRRG